PSSCQNVRLVLPLQSLPWPPHDADEIKTDQLCRALCVGTTILREQNLPARTDWRSFSAKWPSLGLSFWLNSRVPKNALHGCCVVGQRNRAKRPGRGGGLFLAARIPTSMTPTA